MTRVSVRRGMQLSLLALVALMVWAAAADADSKKHGSKKHRPVPAIFVHGNSGSAQQFESDAMRFTSNGYPHSRLFVYEYDTSPGVSNDAAIANLDGFIADVKAKTGADKVDILAHSRGTTVMHAFLETPARAEQVRRYVNFDGRTSATEPGGVPTLAVWGEGDQTREIGGAENVYFPDKAHTEVTTSSAAFYDVYKFLNGRAPKTTKVLPEPPGQVTVAGRSALFPSNAGYDGARLEIYRVRAATGARIGGPRYAVTLGPDGTFGPFKVNGKKRYELVVSKDGESTIHNYPEPFERDDHFYRVLTAPLLAPFIETGPNHTSIAVTRMREFWGDQADPTRNDRLEFDGNNVLTPAIAPRARRVLAVFNFDKGSDGVTDTSASLFPFSVLSFLTGVDNFLPASPDASGTIAVEETMRDPGGQQKTTNVPNWPSSEDTVSVYFKDYAAAEYRRSRHSKHR
jgi:pimeloyl-ACP methyl ester carboxylesterase